MILQILLKPVGSLARRTLVLLLTTLLGPAKVSVAGSDAKVAIKRTTANIWPASGDTCACHGPASAPSEKEQMFTQRRQHQAGLLFTGGRSFALLLRIHKYEDRPQIPQRPVPIPDTADLLRPPPPPPRDVPPEDPTQKGPSSLKPHHPAAWPWGV